MTDVPQLALWVVPVADLGGVARHVLDVVAQGIPGFRIIVLSPPGDLPARIRASGGAVVEGDFGPEAGLWHSRRTLARVVELLRPAVIHTHLAYADIVAATLTQTFGAITATTEHGIAADDTLYASSRNAARVKQSVHRYRLKRTDHAIAVSQSTAQLMKEKWGAGDVTVIANGVAKTSDPELIRRTLGQGIRILSLARLAPEKNIQYLLRAMPEILRRDPRAHLTIAGEGPERDNLDAIVDELSLQESVTFPGHVEAQEAMRNHDMLVQLSAWENLSYALLDARARDLPVVASRVGGNGEIFDEAHLLDDLSPTEIVSAVARGGARPAANPLASVESMTAAIGRVYRGESV
nr:glycosyltransferase family 4 protein [Bowdeniella massiliensis]